MAGDLTLSLVRHGKTAGNLRRAYVGGTDQPLAPEGVAGLRAIASAGRCPPVEAVFSSPMRRCVQTAAILYPGRDPTPVEGLRERHFGDFEGLTHGEIIARPGLEAWGMDPNHMDFPGGEERDAFFRRCSDAFWETANRCVQAGISRAAVVTHGGVIMAVLHLYCEPVRDYYGWFCPNGGGYVVRCDVKNKRLVWKETLE